MLEQVTEGVSVEIEKGKLSEKTTIYQKDVDISGDVGFQWKNGARQFNMDAFMGGDAPKGLPVSGRIFGATTITPRLAGRLIKLNISGEVKDNKSVPFIALAGVGFSVPGINGLGAYINGSVQKDQKPFGGVELSYGKALKGGVGVLVSGGWSNQGWRSVVGVSRQFNLKWYFPRSEP